MYKHMADSIKETAQKRFISQVDKDKYDKYNERFIISEDVYTKEEIDDIAKNMNIYQREYVDTHISVNETKKGFVTNLEVFGNTKQRKEIIEITPEMEPGFINHDTGGEASDDNRQRTIDFIEVEYGDVVSFINDISGEENFANLHLFDANKNFIKYVGFLNKTDIPYGCKFVKYHHRADYSVSKFNITRTHLDDIQSVGEELGDDTYQLELKSCGKNLFSNNIEHDGKYYYFEHGNIDISPDYYSYIVRVHPNTSYIISCNLPVIITEISNITYWDSEMNFICGQAAPRNVVTPSNCRYIRFAGHKELDYIQIEKGTENTNYEEYKEGYVSINLPVQLEGIGKHKDKLFKREDGVWCIEKKIATVIYDGSPDEGWSTLFNEIPLEMTNLYVSNFSTNVIPMTTHIISDRFKQDSEQLSTDKESIHLYQNNNFDIRILKSKASNLEEFKKWLSENNVKVKYPLKVPEIIELPLDVQIQLNSFDGTTNIFSVNSLTDPTIKCVIPTSLGDSVNNNVKCLNDIKNRVSKIETLEESTRYKFQSDIGVCFIEKSNNGVIDDIKIEGNTMVNDVIEYTGPMMSNTALSATMYILKTNIKQNTVYTMFISGAQSVGSTYLREYSTETMIVEPSRSKIKVFNSGDYEVDKLCVGISPLNQGDTFTENDLINFRVVIVEGDYSHLGITNLEYFEGIRSLGEDEKNDLCLTSRNDTGNLFPINGDEFIFTSKNDSWHDLRGNAFMYNNMSNKTDTFFYLSEGYYTLTYGELSNVSQLQLISINDSISLSANETRRYLLPEGLYLVRAKAEASNKECKVSNVMLYKTDLGNKPYKMAEISSKPLIYLDTEDNTYKPIPALRDLPDGTKDTIEKHKDGKWYFHKRCDEILIDGSSDEIHEISSVNNQIETLAVNVRFPNACISGVNSNHITTRNTMFKSVCFNDEVIDQESVMQGHIAEDATQQQYIRIRVLKSKLRTPDLAGYKAWVANNPITVVYRLEKEEVYEMFPLNLETYSGETSVSLNTSKMFGKISFTTTKYIGDLVSVLRKRASKIQEYIINRTLFQNRMLLTNTYNADKTSLKVDITATYNSNMHDIDYELYDLICKNINVGISNYNRDRMEELIDFYTVIGKLDFDMADNLFMIINKQHENMIEY